MVGSSAGPWLGDRLDPASGKAGENCNAAARSRTSKHGSPILARVGAAFAVLTLALGGLELGLRAFAPIDFMRPLDPSQSAVKEWADLVHRRSSVSGLDYELAPNVDREARGMRVHTNSLGMRDDEPLPADTPGLRRIAVLGDSYAFGYQVDAEQAFPALLERELDQAARTEGGRCDVLNFGTPGYSTADEIVVLRAKALALKPELVLLAYCLNDPETAPLQPLPRYFASAQWWQHSEILRRLARREQGREIERLGDGNYYRYLHAPEGRRWRGVADNFASMRALLAPDRIAGAVVIFPMITVERWSDYPYRELHARVAAEAERNGFAVLDLLPAFEAHDPRELVIGDEDWHPSVLGHRIAAEELARFVRCQSNLSTIQTARASAARTTSSANR